MSKWKPSLETYKKWSDGYYGKSVTNSKYGNSSFWLDEDIITQLDKSDTIDTVKLATYLRAISNFVKILTGKDDIKVQFSTKDNSFTDGKTVTVSGKLDTGDFDTTVGLALHEAAHCLLTDFSVLKNAMYTDSRFSCLSYTDQALLKDIVNIIEDRRIDYYVMKNAPGYYGYYKALYETYFQSKDIDLALKNNIWNEESREHYINHMINFVNPNRNLSALKQLKLIWSMVGLANIGRLKNTNDVIELSYEIFKVIIDAEPKAKANSEDNTEPTPSPDINEGEQPMQGQGGSDEESNDEMGGTGADINAQGEESTESTNAPAKEMSPAQMARLKKAMEKMKEFTEGKVKKKNLKAKDVQAIESAIESGVSIESVDIGSAKKEVLVVKGMHSKVLESEIVSNAYSAPNGWRGINDRYSKAVEEGYILGTLLGRKLKTRDEERTLLTTRLAAGRIDKRLIAELGFGNDKVFNQLLSKKAKNSYLHMSLDASGSMGGDSWCAAIKTAVAIAKACSMCSNIHVRIDVRGTAGGRNYNGERALVWVVYDSKKDNITSHRHKLANLYPGSSTPEGLCYAAISKEIIGAAKGKDAFFINVSDGEPAFSGYGGQVAYDHTRKEVRKFRSEGINILSYFVTTGGFNSAGISSSLKNFRHMYEKDAVSINLDNLAELSKTVNNLFTVNNNE